MQTSQHETGRAPVRPIPLNPAEIVLLPFFEAELLDAFAPRFTVNAARGVTQKQGFNWRNFAWRGREPEDVLLTVEADLDVALDRFDLCFVHGSFPRNVRVRCELTIDGERRCALDAVTAENKETEFEAPVTGRRLTGIRLSLVSAAHTDAEQGWLLMLGLGNRRARAELLAPAVPEDWYGAVQSTDHIKDRVPRLGLWFGSEELAVYRERARSRPFAPLMEQLRAEAADCLRDSVPEEMLHVPNTRSLIQQFMFARPWMNRYWRGLSMPARLCAFLGLLDDDPALLRYAARCVMAMSAGHRWRSIGVTGELPPGYPAGAALSGRAIVESLDWAGAALTERGRHVAWDGLMCNSVGHLLNVMTRQEWLYHHNHGTDGAAQLAFIGLALEKAHPRRGAWLLPLAERMLVENLQGCWLDDGATAEGPGYWGGSLNKIAVLLPLARHRGLSPRDYIRRQGFPDALLRTGDYFLTLLSNDPKAPAGTYLPQNDSGWCNHAACGPEALAMLALITEDAVWRAQQSRRLANLCHRFEAYSAGPQVLFMPEPVADPAPARSPIFQIMPCQGNMTSRRPSPLGDVRFNLFGWPGGAHGHEHQDKGSLILEVDGRQLLIDPGMTLYMDPRVAAFKQAQRHNLLLPLDEQGRSGEQRFNCPAPLRVEGSGDEKSLRASLDLTPVWHGLFTLCRRELRSDEPLVTELLDTAERPEPGRVAQIFQSLDPIETRGGEWRIRCGGGALVIAPQWQPEEARLDTELADFEDRPIHRLRLIAPAVRRHALRTILRISQEEDSP
ncbi:MAG: heparinase II/III family protein [Lentisphaerae bacterium]|nr:heparinase II/III family protein [Lentisphaerota bacterium]